jgi:hypothetical protein
VRTPMETEAPAASQPLLPRHQCPLATIDVAQSLPAAPTSRRSCRSPRSKLVVHAPWTPRACNVFPSMCMSMSISLVPRTILHGIERALMRHTRLARLRLDMSCL